jgi:hypothetical protein
LRALAKQIDERDNNSDCKKRRHSSRETSQWPHNERQASTLRGRSGQGRYARPQGDSHTTFDVLRGGDFIFLEHVKVGDLSSLNPVMIAVFNRFGDLRARVEATDR